MGASGTGAHQAPAPANPPPVLPVVVHAAHPPAARSLLEDGGALGRRCVPRTVPRPLQTAPERQAR